MTPAEREEEDTYTKMRKLNLMWRMSASGNWWATACDGWRITVYQDAKRGGWKFMFVLGDEDPVWSNVRFDDPADAKQAAARLFVATLD
jgi:hypothetical protein